jgi:hypothetical protein
MSEIPKKQLLEWKARIELEIREMEQRIAPLTEKLRGLREKHQAIQSLVGPASDGAPPYEVTPSNGVLRPANRQRVGASTVLHPQKLTGSRYLRA